MKKRNVYVQVLFMVVFILIACFTSQMAVSAAETVPTEQEAYNAIMGIKSTYYEGRSWTNSNYYKWNGGMGINGGYGCAGFAFACSDAAFGNLSARQVYNVSIDDVHVGDILRINDDSHSVVVLKKYSDHIVIAEGNFNASIHWGRELTAEQVEDADFMITRYPVGTFDSVYTITYDANGGSKAPDSQKKETTTITLTNVVPTYFGYQCEGWALTADAATPKYRPGAMFSLNKDTTLYAVWKKVDPIVVSSFPCTKNATILIPGSAAYYEITAPLSGTYTFSAVSPSGEDTYGVLFSSEWKKIAFNDDSNGDSDFKLTYHLERGKTYYLQARYYLNTNEYFASKTGSFKVSISMVADAVQPSAPLSILSQPVDVSTESGGKVIIGLQASGEELTYQWYYKMASSSSFSLWSGKTRSSFSYYPSNTKDGMQAYCIVTDGSGKTVTSDTITIHITGIRKNLEILEQPKDVTIQSGEVAYFSIEADGDGLTYQWYFKLETSSKFSAWGGRTKESFGYCPADSRDGMQVYCVVTDEYGDSVTSNTVTLTILGIPQELVILQQPQDIVITEGEKAIFSCLASGDGLTYQWYFKLATSSKFTAWGGRTKASFGYIPAVTRDGMQAYCQISDQYGNTVVTNTITLTIYPA